VKDNLEPMIYFMAAEKVGGLVYSIEQTLEYLEEFKIEPDEEVRKILKPVLEKLAEWVK
jgi:hypothetical protein